MDDVTFVCKEGTQEWLDCRQDYITASDSFTLLAPVIPKWWSTSKQDVHDGKFKDIERDFDMDAKRKMWWGSNDEAANMEAASEIMGCPMAPYQWLVNNPKWEHLAGTPDGVVVSDVMYTPNLVPTSCANQVKAARRRMIVHGGTGLVEMKNTKEPYRRKSGGTSWFDVPPEYYADYQVQFQLHLTGAEWSLLIGKLGGNDMSVHFIMRDPSFEAKMDELNHLMAGWKKDNG
jgi:hypothetical protein